jgi:hypothetical protein
MIKSYADECLERAEKAFHKPALLIHKPIQDKCPSCKHASQFDGQCINHFCSEYYPTIPDRSHEQAYSDFIAHARTDVPELARRLKDAIGVIAALLESLECREDEDCDHCVAKQAILELEAPLNNST